MINKSTLTKFSLGNYVYNNKVNAIAQIISISEQGVKTRWLDGEDTKHHLDIDLIPITIDYLYNILGLKLYIDDDPVVKEYNKEADFYDYFRLIRFTDYNVKVNKLPLWYVHIDNLDHDTKGSGEFQFIHEFQNFINSIDFDMTEVINQANVQTIKEFIND